MIALFKAATGRGPTRAQTYVEDGLIVTLLYDTMTKAEQTLKEENKEDTVRSLRRIFQGTFREDAIEVVERLTGRKVLAFLSQAHVDPDITLEVFFVDRPLEGFGAVEVLDAPS
jgi:uncharacterized protein YbcI